MTEVYHRPWHNQRSPPNQVEPEGSSREQLAVLKFQQAFTLAIDGA
jgi:hypothetical protein